MIDISKEIVEKLERGCSYEFESAICENVVAKTRLVLQDSSILISSRLYTQIPVASWKDAERIFGEIARSFHFGSMVECQNPAYCVNTISGPCKFRLHGNSKYSFRCETDLWVDVDLVTLEGNDALYINVPAQCAAKDFLRREVPDTYVSRVNRPVLPLLPSENDIDKWIADAKLIDISEIIKQYGEEGLSKNGDLS